MANRRITANTRVKIRQMVEILATFLPLSSHSKSAVTFKTIFSGSKVDKYLEGAHKKQALQKGWEEIIRRHIRLPQTLIRKIVPAAIDYRRYKRKPLKQTELDNLIDCLEALDIHMRKELCQIQLDESTPKIKVPPSELVSRLENHPLAEEIASDPLQLFKNGHFNESVRKASEKFEVKVKSLTGSNDIGKSLMSKAFKLDSPLITLTPLSNDNEKGVQEGYMYMTMGMMRALRNVFSHGDEDQRSPEECYEILIFINWLFRILNQCEK